MPNTNRAVPEPRSEPNQDTTGRLLPSYFLVYCTIPGGSRIEQWPEPRTIKTEMGLKLPKKPFTRSITEASRTYNVQYESRTVTCFNNSREKLRSNSCMSKPQTNQTFTSRAAHEVCICAGKGRPRLRSSESEWMWLEARWWWWKRVQVRAQPIPPSEHNNHILMIIHYTHKRKRFFLGSVSKHMVYDSAHRHKESSCSTSCR